MLKLTLLFAAGIALAQSPHASLPSTCSPGEVNSASGSIAICGANNQWTAIPSITLQGYGVCVTGTGMLYSCANVRTNSGLTDTVTPSDVGNIVRLTNKGAVTEILPNPKSLTNTPICMFRITSEGAGGVTVSASGATIGGKSSVSIPKGGSSTSPKFAVFYISGGNYVIAEHN